MGDKMNKIISKLADANDLLKGVIDVADFNDADKLGKGKEMVDRLSNLVGIFANPSLDFSSNRAEGDDLLGDAYEYLIRHFATQSGKSKGQFYTPAEVSRVMAKVVGVGTAKSANQTIHDPTCGSGSLLLRAHDEAKSTAGLDLALYGQEMDNATKSLAVMNMILHDCPTAEIWQDNVLASPHFKSKTAHSRPSISSSPIHRSPSKRGATGSIPPPTNSNVLSSGCPRPKTATTLFCFTFLPASRAPPAAAAHSLVSAATGFIAAKDAVALRAWGIGPSKDRRAEGRNAWLGLGYQREFCTATTGFMPGSIRKRVEIQWYSLKDR
jgi:hypothetical protein